MKITVADVVSPANFATLIGLVLTIHGSMHLETLQGVIEIAVGRALDVLDGPIARATHASRFGAAVDATADKIAIAAVIIGAWHFSAVPKPFLALIAALNIISAIIALLAANKRSAMEASTDGKYSMFLNIAAIVCFAFGNVLELAILQKILWVAGITLGIAGIIFGLQAIRGYYSHTYEQKNNKTTA